MRTHVWPWLQHPGAQGLGMAVLRQKDQQNLPESWKTTLTCMSLEAPRQSTSFCWLHGIGFCLDQQPCSEIQVISFFPLKSRVIPVLLPALLAKGRMLAVLKWQLAEESHKNISVLLSSLLQEWDNLVFPGTCHFLQLQSCLLKMFWGTSSKGATESF